MDSVHLSIQCASGREKERERVREREREKERERERDVYECSIHQPQVPLHFLSPSLCYPPVAGELVDLGQLLISRDSTVEDLKLMLLTLPAVSTLSGCWSVSYPYSAV